jgi:hypothetical protein
MMVFLFKWVDKLVRWIKIDIPLKTIPNLAKPFNRPNTYSILSMSKTIFRKNRFKEYMTGLFATGFLSLADAIDIKKRRADAAIAHQKIGALCRSGKEERNKGLSP